MKFCVCGHPQLEHAMSGCWHDVGGDDVFCSCSRPFSLVDSKRRWRSWFSRIDSPAPLLVGGLGLLAVALVGWFKPSQDPRWDRCFEDEAHIQWLNRETCYPVDNLPVELQAYIVNQPSGE